MTVMSNFRSPKNAILVCAVHFVSTLRLFLAALEIDPVACRTGGKESKKKSLDRLKCEGAANPPPVDTQRFTGDVVYAQI